MELTDRKYKKHTLTGVIQGHRKTIDWEVPIIYENLQFIGCGSYGVVCSADRCEPGKNVQKVAIKKFEKPFQTMKLKYVQRAYRELHILREVNHENVVDMLDLFTTDKPTEPLLMNVYFVSTLMDADLELLIRDPHYHKRPDAYDRSHICLYVYEIVKALKYIHSANIIHRDLKPSNIGVSSDNKIKILDFGMARIEENNMTNDVTTYWYRAPETFYNPNGYTAAVDMWSVGCIMAELMTRKVLFRVKSDDVQFNIIQEIVGTENMMSELSRYSIRNVEPKPGKDFTELFPNADDVEIDFLKKILHPDPSSRLTAADALAHEYLMCDNSTEIESHFEMDKNLTMDPKDVEGWNNKIRQLIEASQSFQDTKNTSKSFKTPAITREKNRIYQQNCRLRITKTKDELSQKLIKVRLRNQQLQSDLHSTIYQKKRLIEFLNNTACGISPEDKNSLIRSLLSPTIINGNFSSNHQTGNIEVPYLPPLLYPVHEPQPVTQRGQTSHISMPNLISAVAPKSTLCASTLQQHYLKKSHLPLQYNESPDGNFERGEQVSESHASIPQRLATAPRPLPYLKTLRSLTNQNNSNDHPPANSQPPVDEPILRIEDISKCSLFPAGFNSRSELIGTENATLLLRRESSNPIQIMQPILNMRTNENIERMDHMRVITSSTNVKERDSSLIAWYLTNLLTMAKEKDASKSAEISNSLSVQLIQTEEESLIQRNTSQSIQITQPIANMRNNENMERMDDHMPLIASTATDSSLISLFCDNAKTKAKEKDASKSAKWNKKQRGYVSIHNTRVEELKLLATSIVSGKPLDSIHEQCCLAGDEVKGLLSNNMMISSKVVDEYLNMLVQPRTQNKKNGEARLRRVKSIGCQAVGKRYGKISEDMDVQTEEEVVSDLRRMLRKLTPAKADLILIPCLFGNLLHSYHYSLIIVDHKQQHIILFDSLHNFHLHSHILVSLIVKAFFVLNLVNVSNYSLHKATESAVQNNAYDCGIFVMDYARRVVMTEIGRPTIPQQEDMVLRRLKLFNNFVKNDPYCTIIS